MRSTTQSQFAQIESNQVERSKFNRSSSYKTTFDAGLLIPVYVEEALPGDTINLTMHNFARLATPLKPAMDNMHLDSFFFSVPYRLIWDNWAKFNGEQRDPGDSVDFVVPQMTETVVEGTMSDYFGIPTGVEITFNSLHHRAMNLIFNEWFRDQNLQDSLVVDTDDGPDDPADYVLQRRGKRHDYFTSALPFPQKGDAVQLPLGTTAPIIADPADSHPQFFTDNPASPDRLQSDGVGNGTIEADVFLGASPLQWAATTGLLADLNAATSATINVIRQAFQIQRLLERDARGGSRYTEIIRSHFGVISPDQRLQRPEYLGGGTQLINLTPVPQTTGFGAPSNTPQANLAAFGTTAGSNHSFVKSFDEHCVVIGMVMVRADLTYQQGLNRMFSRRTRYDYFWPTLSHLGEQTILNKEIYAQGDAEPLDEEVFGYQERYAEYRFAPSKITGQFRSQYIASLDYWHLAQDFSSLPVLDSDFIEENPPIDRIIAIPGEPHFLFDAVFQNIHARPIPAFGTPGLIDHL